MPDFLVFLIVWAVFSALGEWAASVWGSHVYYSTASAQALDGVNATDFILKTLIPLFVFVVLILVFALTKFRAKRGESGNSVYQFKTNKVYISLWLAITVSVNFIFLLHPTASATEAMFNQYLPQNNKNDLIVNVVARQWEWYFNYPQYGVTNTVDANGNAVLELPVGRKVEFILRSYDPNHTYDTQLDVIHSFWIPAFGLKEDIIPGETRVMYVLPNTITNTAVNPMLRVQCAEVCGPGHPYMEANAAVVSAGNFNQWIALQKKNQAS